MEHAREADLAADDLTEIEGLAKAAARGDGTAMGDLYERYTDAIYRHVFIRTGGNHADTEDLCQDVWVRVARGIGNYEPQGKGFPAWLYTIANNVVKSHYRRRSCRPESPTGEMFHLDQPSIEVGPEEAAVRSMTSRELAAAVAKLTPGQRECVVLRFFEGLSVAETASVMGQTQGAIKQAQHRAIRKLSKILPPEMRILGGSLSVSSVQAYGAASAVAR